MYTIKGITDLDSYNMFVSDMLRNINTSKEHYENNVLSDVFFKSNIVNPAAMLLLKKATIKINDITKNR